MRKKSTKIHSRIRRRSRVRSVVVGTQARPRLSVFRSARHIYAQLINDQSHQTLAAVSSLKAGKKKVKKSEEAKAIGLALAQMAVKLGIKKASFDRGGYAYHGRVKALAEGAREGGLEF